MSSTVRSHPFSGLSAFPLTPADADGRVDTSMLVRLLERLCDAQVDSIGLLGSTGTYAYLTREERRRAVEAAVDCVKGRVPLIVGVGALRTDHAVELARDAEAAGADALLMAPVSYTPLTQEEVFEHYRTVSAKSDLPFCVYNNPSTTHFTFDFDLLERLSNLPTIQAVKMPLPVNGNIADEVSALRQRIDLSIGYSGDWGMADAMLAGADAFYSVLGGLLPQPVLAIVRAAEANDDRGVRLLDQKLKPLWSTFKAYGSLRVMYALLEAFGLPPAHPPRPLLPLDAKSRDEILSAAAPFLVTG